MKSTTSAALLVLTLVVAMGDACADLVWRAPATLAAPDGASGNPPAAAVSGGGHAGHGGGSVGGHAHQRRAETLRLLDTDDVRVELWTPDIKREEVIVAGDTLTLPWTGRGNYHAVVAQRDAGALHESAVRYVYLRGEPTERSPSDLLAVDKAPLEIVPRPLAREHHRYLSGRLARFRIRYHGRPLATAAVSLETSNGSFVEGRTDAEGRITFRLPDDFAQVRVGRMNNPPADFIVRVQHAASEQRYRASLSAAYSVNPRHWESNRAGLAAAASGFIVGLGILRVASRRSARGNGGREA